MFPELAPVVPSDKSFLFEIYASSRTEELQFVPWTDEQKHAFLQSQFQAQHDYYFSNYPNGSFNLIKINGAAAGRLYMAESGGEIRIIDMTLLPEFRNQGIGTRLISDVLEDGAVRQKSVTICLETYNRSQNLFSRLGFICVSNDGVYCLWEKNFDEKNEASKGSAFSTATEAI